MIVTLAPPIATIAANQEEIVTAKQILKAVSQVPVLAALTKVVDQAANLALLVQMAHLVSYTEAGLVLVILSVADLTPAVG